MIFAKNLKKNKGKKKKFQETHIENVFVKFTVYQCSLSVLSLIQASLHCLFYKL